MFQALDFQSLVLSRELGSLACRFVVPSLSPRCPLAHSTVAQCRWTRCAMHSTEQTVQCTALSTQYTVQSTQNTIFSASSSRSGACPSKCPFGQPEQFQWPSAMETSLICYWAVGILTNSLAETTHRGTKHLFSNPAGWADRCVWTNVLRHSGPFCIGGFNFEP